MVTITVNISQELFDVLALTGAAEDKSPQQVLTERIDYYFEFQRLLDKMVQK